MRSPREGSIPRSSSQSSASTRRRKGAPQPAAARISQLGGTANFDPHGIGTRAHSTFATSQQLGEMIRQDLEAERVAIDIYREMITWFGNQDPTTRRILETILAQEEEHADDMASLLTTFVDDART